MYKQCELYCTVNQLSQWAITYPIENISYTGTVSYYNILIQIFVENKFRIVLVNYNACTYVSIVRKQYLYIGLGPIPVYIININRYEMNRMQSIINNYRYSNNEHKYILVLLIKLIKMTIERKPILILYFISINTTIFNGHLNIFKR
jgi:hypothetical protein